MRWNRLCGEVRAGLIAALALIFMASPARGDLPGGQQQQQVTNGGGYAVVSRTLNSRVWQQTIVLTNEVGETNSRTVSYTEMATGLCRTLQDGSLTDSVVQIDPVADGAGVARAAANHSLVNRCEHFRRRGHFDFSRWQRLFRSTAVAGLAYLDTGSGFQFHDRDPHQLDGSDFGQ